MNTIFIVPIEPIDQRYTKQWYDNIPVILRTAISERNLPYTVAVIDGEQPETGTTTGAFLDFGATNVYKATQAAEISRLFSSGIVKAGDKFLVTDAWNFVITPIKYMSDLLDIPVEIHGIWHAGAYDPTDILGYKMQKPWPWHAERSWFHSCDYNYYATNFHKNMFLRNLGIEEEYHHKAVRSGQPHTPIIEQCEQYYDKPKCRQLMWPHRYNADKQPEIVEDLHAHAGIDTVITQKLNLSKADYYQRLGEVQVLFSCSLHENLGISMMEGVLAGCIPIVPDRASYSEMYLSAFKYPSEWTSSWDNYLLHRDKLVAFINQRLDNPGEYKELLSLIHI
jgi:hypothetical protein